MAGLSGKLFLFGDDKQSACHRTGNISLPGCPLPGSSFVAVFEFPHGPKGQPGWLAGGRVALDSSLGRE